MVVLAYLSWVLMYLGHFEEARARSTEALENARRFAQAYPLTHALNGAAYVELTLGDYAAALRHLDELDETLEEHGIAYYRSISQVWRGWCLAALGEPFPGLQHLTRGLAAYRAAGTEVYVPAFLRFLAEVYRAAGQPENALAQLDEAARIMVASNAHGDEGEMLRVRGLSLLDLNDFMGAEECLRAAIKVARKKAPSCGSSAQRQTSHVFYEAAAAPRRHTRWSFRSAVSFPKTQLLMSRALGRCSSN